MLACGGAEKPNRSAQGYPSACRVITDVKDRRQVEQVDGPCRAPCLPDKVSKLAHDCERRVDLTALTDVCLGDTEPDTPFGALICAFTVQSGVSGAHDEAWVY